MDLGIRGRRALVGGASRGLGRAIAERLAAEGCDLVLTARTGADLDMLAADLRARYGTAAHGVAADMTDPGAPGALAAAAQERLGGIDILVLNAGGPPPSDPDATTPDGWRLALQLLTISPIDLATRLLPTMRAQRWGRVVAVSSYAVRQPIDDLVYSTAGRAALIAWLKTTARAVALDGVTLNAALPGRHATARIEQLDQHTAEQRGVTKAAVRSAHEATIPARRYGRPDEFAAYVAYLCSEPAAYITGTTTAVDGGLVNTLL